MKNVSPNLLSILPFLPLFLRLKLLDLAGPRPPLPGGVLDEQLDLLRRAQRALGETPLDRETPDQARASFTSSIRLLKKAGGLFEKVAAVCDLTIPGPAGAIPARLYLPGEEKTYPLFIYFHGGGWTIGDLDSADNIARFICRRAGCSVLSVDYRLAPEHPFPAGVDDAFAAVQWAVRQAAELHGDPQHVLVGGDSAGATLSAVISQLALHKGSPRLAGQVLFYAATNAAGLDTPSFKEFGEKALGLPTRDVRWFLDQYTPDSRDRRDPRVSPLFARDLYGLPPALVVTAEFDVLRDEGEEYARRLEKAGVPVTLLRCNGMVHGFLTLVGLIKRSTQYFDQVIVEIRRLAAA